MTRLISRRTVLKGAALSAASTLPVSTTFADDRGRTRQRPPAAAVQAHPAYPLDGVDLVPLLQRAGSGAPALSRQLFWRIGGQRAVREGNLKYVRLANASQVVTQGGPPAALLGTEFLFDVVEDPRERANLLAARPEDAARLSAAWEAWNATVLPEPVVGTG